MYKGVGTLRAAFGFSPQSSRSSTEFFLLVILTTEGRIAQDDKGEDNYGLKEKLCETPCPLW